MMTTTVEPARPRKNIASTTRIAKTTMNIYMIVACSRPDLARFIGLGVKNLDVLKVRLARCSGKPSIRLALP
jgi:hypothetical protein